MKIGILTFHCAHNYGAVLQCYALQEVLKSLGHNVKVIDYRPTYLVNCYKTLKLTVSRHPRWLLKHTVKEFLKFSREKRRHQAFSRFIESRLDLSPRSDGKFFVSNMDAYIFGSDQIWSPAITRGFDDIYWGKLPFNKGNKKYITYAASLGKESLTEEEKECVSENLKNFDAVSVRESSLKNLLAPLTDKKVEQVLDPTLLAPCAVWDKLDDKIEEGKYVLVYQVRQDPNTMAIARHIAQQINAKIVILEAYVNWRNESERKSCASPEDFVAYIKHASCVVTTSFHGTAFSVIFNKPFYCLKFSDSTDARSKSLLRSLHLENRMIDKRDRPSFSDIDYSEANVVLNQWRKDSMAFLQESLG